MWGVWGGGGGLIVWWGGVDMGGVFGRVVYGGGDGSRCSILQPVPQHTVPPRPFVLHTAHSHLQLLMFTEFPLNVIHSLFQAFKGLCRLSMPLTVFFTNFSHLLY
uniref:Secreted protein n=1 Tax=Knipowitschia caucasica TaxID=637954 RepID=A0AAV2M433_KNICA